MNTFLKKKPIENGAKIKKFESEKNINDKGLFEKPLYNYKIYK